MKKTILVSLVILIVVIATQHTWLLSQYALFFTVDTATPGADVIIVLSGNNTVRIPFALKLFKDGYAPRLMLTTEVRRKEQRFCLTNIEIAHLLMQESTIETELSLIPSLKSGASSTFDEAYDVLEFSQKQGLKRLILVTDSFHTRRALYAFRKVFGEHSIELEMAAAPNEYFDETNWWKSEIGIVSYFWEGIKFPLYLFTHKNASIVKNY